MTWLFFYDTATTGIYTYSHTLSLHDARPISRHPRCARRALGAALPRPIPVRSPRRRDSANPVAADPARPHPDHAAEKIRSEEHTSELQSLMRNSYAVFCLKNKINNIKQQTLSNDLYLS